MSLDPQVEALRRARVAAGTRRVRELTVDEARAAQAAEDSTVRDDSFELETHDIQGPASIRLYRPPCRDPVPVCVWLPGGGWVVDTTVAAGPACRRIAAETPCAIAVVRYRLAPEHPFPAAVDDCTAATRWLLDHASQLGLDPRRLAIGGTSAGGNLAAALTLIARERGDMSFAAQVLVYPILLYQPPVVRGDESAEGSFFDRRDVDWCWSHYLADVRDGSNPLASPVLADDLAGLPPALVVTAGLDPLRDEAERYAIRLRRAGVQVEVVAFDGVPHGFFSLAGVLDAAGDAQLSVIRALRAAFAAAATPRTGSRLRSSSRRGS